MESSSKYHIILPTCIMTLNKFAVFVQRINTTVYHIFYPNLVGFFLSIYLTRLASVYDDGSDWPNQNLTFSAENIQALRRARERWKRTACGPKCLLRPQSRWWSDFHQLERNHHRTTQHQYGWTNLLTDDHMWPQLPRCCPHCTLLVKSQHSLCEPRKRSRGAKQVPSIRQMELRNYNGKDSDRS